MEIKTDDQDFFEELPIGFAMALAMHGEAMKHFETLKKEEQKSIIEKAKNVDTKEEMQALVKSLYL